jgi:hypothetical protein
MKMKETKQIKLLMKMKGINYVIEITYEDEGN